ncbi:type VI secretion system protein ImpE [Izhakiella capsodis]|uniref:Type VI secretion system protein ImpE n=1 Tax=Izhakiella capsodis TaxID=1367852 RepID=A0A1I5ASE1_9GAMM|nr:type VI secretion system accessory protein TagJ [Izhakiella capsodis]SFN65365.1 type VI secretion system protein ImpE [Izhakiella capsodis]
MSTGKTGLITEMAEIDKMIAQSVDAVKTNPKDFENRLTLIKLYCLQSKWDNALHQLVTLQKIEPAVQQQCELYNNLIYSERMRESVLLGERAAGLVGNKQPVWINDLLKANALYAAGQFVEGERVRGQCIEAASAQPGYSSTIGEFEWLADGDDRLGPVCEFISAGAYRWVPVADIQSLLVNEPQGISDLIWAPAEIVIDGQTWKGYLPARYPLSITSEQSLKVGSKTEWQRQEGGRYIGLGRKMWITNLGEYSLFETGELTFSKRDNLQ